MKALAKLFTAIDQTTSTNDKIDALVAYFDTAPAEDAIWCIALLTGRRPKRVIKTGELWIWAEELSKIPQWLFTESYSIVGDLAETITLLLPAHSNTSDYALHEVMRDMAALQDKGEEERKAYVTTIWSRLNKQELFVFNKLITGGFRMGVSDKIVIKALAKHFSLDENIVAHRLSGQWEPQSNTPEKLLKEENTADTISRPYPFYLAYPLESPPAELGDVKEWFIEYKYDGIRGQIIVRDNQLFIWSRGEDLLTEKFVEFHELVHILPNGTVLDGEMLPCKDGKFLSFNAMQTRIGRKNITKKAREEAPLVMVCYDILEHNGVDIRHLSLQERRSILENLLQLAHAKHTDVPLILSSLVVQDSWEEITEVRSTSRDASIEGLMLKNKHSVYKTGRRRGDWWKWKIDPLSIDGVLVYAQRGHGRRADLYTDFTFAVWNGDELVPFAKAYSGLTDKEMAEVDAWIKKNTKEKFGPVRSVTPELVFEIGFEGINASSRHKSGIALRFPRILRWRKDKSAKEANTKEDLEQLARLYQ